MLAVEGTRDAIEIGELLARTVREAGALALAKFGTPLKSWIKNKSSPVTEADIAVDALLRDRLGDALPDCVWLSEEMVDDRARCQSRRLWIVDPIDGTRAFMAGQPDWTIVAALVEDGRPLVGAIHAPVDDQLFLACVGRGATLNGRKIVAGAGTGLEGIRVAGPPRRLDALARVIPTMIQSPKVHSLALRLARVASGELDAALVGSGSHDWDLAAADLLVHEAGGALTTLEGRPLVYNRPDPVHAALVAAGADRHHALIGVVRDAQPKS